MGVIPKQLVGREGIPVYLREAIQEGQKDIGGRELLLANAEDRHFSITPGFHLH